MEPLLLNRPQRHGILVLDEQAIAGNDGIGMRLRFRHLNPGQFLVALVTRLERNQFRTGSQSQHHGTRINDASIAPASPASTSAPTGTARSACATLPCSTLSGSSLWSRLAWPAGSGATTTAGALTGLGQGCAPRECAVLRVQTEQFAGARQSIEQ